MTERSQHLRWYRGTAAERSGYDTDTLVAPALWFEEDDSEAPRYWDGSAWVAVGKASSINGTEDRLAAFDATGAAVGDSQIADAVSGGVLSLTATLTADRAVTFPDTAGTVALLEKAQTYTATQTFPNTGLHLLDTDASHDLIVAPGSDLTADRTLTLTTGDADREVALQGDLTVPETGIAALLGTANTFTAAQTIQTASTARLTLDGTSTEIIYDESDQAGSAGLYKMWVNGNRWRLSQNTSASRDFSTRNDIFTLYQNKLGVGTIFPAAQLDADQSSATGAQPVLRLNQGDASEEAILVSYDSSDVDMRVIKLDVTGAPVFGWDESEDAFSYTHDLVAIRTTTTSDRLAGALTWEWDDATDATRAAVGKLYAEDYGASREVIAWGANGTAATLGFYAATPVTQQDVTGARDDAEAALANLLSALDSLGLITDSTTAT